MMTYPVNFPQRWLDEKAIELARCLGRECVGITVDLHEGNWGVDFIQAVYDDMTVLMMGKPSGVCMTQDLYGITSNDFHPIC